MTDSHLALVAEQPVPPRRWPVGGASVTAVDVVEMVAVVMVISCEPCPVAPIRTLSQWVSATAAVDDGEKCETEKGVPQTVCGTPFIGQATSASSSAGASSFVRL